MDQLSTVSHEAIVFDAGFGEIREFLQALDKRGKIFIDQVPESHCFWPEDIALKQNISSTGRPRRFPEVKDKTLKPLSAKEWGNVLLKEAKWKKIRLSLASKPLYLRNRYSSARGYCPSLLSPWRSSMLVVEKYWKRSTEILCIQRS